MTSFIYLSNSNLVHKYKVIQRPTQRRSAVKARSAKVPDSLVQRVDDPIARAALKEPLAFWGGVVAGILRVNLDEEPLKSWVEQTAEQAGGNPPVPRKQRQSRPGNQSRK